MTNDPSSVPSAAAALRVGIVGIGSMGFALAQRLRGLGWPLAVRDIDPRRTRHAASIGAAVCASSLELAAGCDCVVICVAGAAQTKTVLFGPRGVMASLAPGSAVMLCSTMAPDETERFTRQLRRRSTDCIDAPLAGSPAQARDGTLSMIVACADAVFERHRALLDALSGKVLRISDRPGDGARARLVGDLLAGINLAGACEAVALAERLGLDAARTLDVIEPSGGQRWIGADRLRLAIEHARGAGFDAPLGRLAADLLEHASARDSGCAALDGASPLAWSRSRNGA